MSDHSVKSRLDWQDADWAKHLNCPVSKIPEYKKILDENFLTAIERDKQSGQYSFALYSYDVAPSGFTRLRLSATGNKSFTNLLDAVRDANNIISCWELSDFWAKAFDVPKQAVQMLLIRQK